MGPTGPASARRAKSCRAHAAPNAENQVLRRNFGEGAAKGRTPERLNGRHPPLAAVEGCGLPCRGTAGRALRGGARDVQGMAPPYPMWCSVGKDCRSLLMHARRRPGRTPSLRAASRGHQRRLSQRRTLVSCRVLIPCHAVPCCDSWALLSARARSCVCARIRAPPAWWRCRGARSSSCGS